MNRSVCRRVAVTFAVVIAGCDAVAPSNVTVVLKNNGNFDVDARVIIDDEQAVPEFLIKTVGEEIAMTIPAGESRTFSRSCEELQAIMIDQADLRIAGTGIGPETDSDLLRDGDDFNCGDTITFTFAHDAFTTNFRVTPSISESTSPGESLTSSLGGLLGGVN